MATVAEYTLTTREVRRHYALAVNTFALEEGEERFDRWLAEVRREAAEQAWDAGWDARHHYDERGGEPAPSNPYRKKETTDD